MFVIKIRRFGSISFFIFNLGLCEYLMPIEESMNLGIKKHSVKETMPLFFKEKKSYHNLFLIN